MPQPKKQYVVEHLHVWGSNCKKMEVLTAANTSTVNTKSSFLTLGVVRPLLSNLEMGSNELVHYHDYHLLRPPRVKRFRWSSFCLFFFGIIRKSRWPYIMAFGRETTYFIITIHTIPLIVSSIAVNNFRQQTNHPSNVPSNLSSEPTNKKILESTLWSVLICLRSPNCGLAREQPSGGGSLMLMLQEWTLGHAGIEQQWKMGFWEMLWRR